MNILEYFKNFQKLIKKTRNQQETKDSIPILKKQLFMIIHLVFFPICLELLFPWRNQILLD